MFDLPSAVGTIVLSFLLVNHNPETFPWTLMVSFASLSIPPISKRERSPREKSQEGLTSHVQNSDPEFLPSPTILSSVDLNDDLLQLVQTIISHPIVRESVSIHLVEDIYQNGYVPSFGLGPHEMLGDFIPILFRHTPLDTPFLDFIQPFLYRHVLLRVTRKHGAVCPLCEDGLEVEFLDLECVEHRGGGGQRTFHGLTSIRKALPFILYVWSVCRTRPSSFA